MSEKKIPGKQMLLKRRRCKLNKKPLWEDDCEVARMVCLTNSKKVLNPTDIIREMFPDVRSIPDTVIF